MTTDNKDNKLSIGSSDYAEILRHAVAVIEHARTEIARHVNGYVSTAYWEIGQMLHERKIESGYGDSVVRSEEHTSELQSRGHLVCRLLLEKKKAMNMELYETHLFVNTSQLTQSKLHS